jgi:hypothetical protein
VHTPVLSQTVWGPCVHAVGIVSFTLSSQVDSTAVICRCQFLCRGKESTRGTSRAGFSPEWHTRFCTGLIANDTGTPVPTGQRTSWLLREGTWILINTNTQKQDSATWGKFEALSSLVIKSTQKSSRKHQQPIGKLMKDLHKQFTQKGMEEALTRSQ